MTNLFKGVSPQTLYILAAVFAGLLIVFAIYSWLIRAERFKTRLLRRREMSEPVEPSGRPIENSEDIARQRGMRSIELRFRLIRRFLIPLFILFWGLLALIPLLSVVSSVYVSLLVGGMTVILGIAAKPWIENLIAGLVITLGQSIRVGDTIDIDDQYGVVEEIALTYCIIKVWDWRRYVIPNQQMIQKEFINLTLKDSFIWKKVEFWVAPNIDLDRVEKIAISAMKSSQSLRAQAEDPSFWIMKLDKEAIHCWVAGWAETPADAWSLGHDTRKFLVQNFREENITFHNYFHETKTELSKIS